MSVDDFLAALDHPRFDDISRVRGALLKREPNVLETIKWNAPNYAFDGEDRVTFRLQPGDNFQIVLHRGAAKRSAEGFVFDDPHGLVAWATVDRGVVKVPVGVGTDVELTDLIDLLSRWLRVS